MSTTQVPPGWYTDPWNPAFLRYWDGHQWTDMTHAAPPNTGPSETNQKHEEKPAKSDSTKSGIKAVADGLTAWFTTGTAAVKFAKALAGLLAFLGVITIGSVIAHGGSSSSGGSSSTSGSGGFGGSGDSGNSSNPAPANLAAALLQPSDLGTSDFFGWQKTQAPTSFSPSCPTYPPTSENHVFTVLSDVGTGMELAEDIWKLAQPGPAISTYMRTAQNCTFTNTAGETVTFQTDDSDGSYGDQSVIYTLGATNPNLPGEAVSITAYDALIVHGNLLAFITLTTGTQGNISQSTLSSIFTGAAKKLLPPTLL